MHSLKDTDDNKDKKRISCKNHVLFWRSPQQKDSELFVGTTERDRNCPKNSLYVILEKIPEKSKIRRVFLRSEHMKDTYRNCSEMSVFLSRNSLIKLCFLRKVVLLVLLPTQKKRKWMERAVGMVRDCLTTKTSGSLVLPHLSAPAAMGSLYMLQRYKK